MLWPYDDLAAGGDGLMLLRAAEVRLAAIPCGLLVPEPWAGVLTSWVNFHRRLLAEALAALEAMHTDDEKLTCEGVPGERLDELMARLRAAVGRTADH